MKILTVAFMLLFKDLENAFQEEHVQMQKTKLCWTEQSLVFLQFFSSVIYIYIYIYIYFH